MGKPEQRIFMQTGLWAARSEFQVPARARDFSFLQNAQNGSGAHSGSFSISNPERPEGEVEKALPTSARIENKWRDASTSYRPS